MLIAAQLRLAGHMTRMDDTRIQKTVFFGQLARGKRHQGAPLKRYKDLLKANLQLCSIESLRFEDAAQNRSQWRQMCKAGVENVESQRTAEFQRNRQQRKDGGCAVGGAFIC